MQSHYRINVSLKGYHFFATAPESCTTEANAAKVYRQLASAFKEKDGYKIDITHWKGSGTEIDPALLMITHR